MTVFTILKQGIISTYTDIEKQIIDLLRKGDKQAIVLSYRHYGKTLLGLIYKVVRNQEAAEEVLQDTFVKIWKNAAAFDSKKGRLFTWYANIARNAAIDKIRSAEFQRKIKTDSLDDIVNNEKTNQTQPNIADPGLQAVINRLDEKYRLLIELVYFKGYSQRAIAKEFNIPLGTIKTRLRTAISQLRSQLQKDYANRLLSIMVLIWICLFL